MTVYPIPDLYLSYSAPTWTWALSDPVKKLRYQVVQAAGNARSSTTYGTSPGASTTTRMARPSSFPPLRCEVAACLFDHGLKGKSLTSHQITDLVNTKRGKQGDKTRREREIKMAQTAFPYDFEDSPKLLSYKTDEEPITLMFMVVPILGLLRSDPEHSSGYVVTDIPALGQSTHVTNRWLHALNRARGLFMDEREKWAEDLVRWGRATDKIDAARRLRSRTVNEIYRQFFFDKAKDISQAHALAQVDALDVLLPP
jgi:hypothetical protein